MLKPENKSKTTKSPEDILREKLIDTARAGWINRLIDLSRRNNLLYWKPILSGTLELPVGNRLLEFLASGEPVLLKDLISSQQDNVARIRAISRKGMENLEEKGLSTLYLALGKATWTSDDGGRDPFAPVLLAPISLELKGQDVWATELRSTGDVEINPVLLHVLNSELNVEITAEELLRQFSPRGEEVPPSTTSSDSAGNDEGSIVNPQAVIDLLNISARNVPGFRAEMFAVVGNFSFQKLSMVKDLEHRRDELMANDIVAAIAGDNISRRKLSESHVAIDPKCLDSILPDNEFAILEADSSQQCAIGGICVGQSAVVHGPPGTGKSQTITNLIATLAATGKKVLFVAEKRAALEVVMNRLTAAGLDHLAIDLHGAEQTPKKVMERVARTLSTVREAARPASDAVHQQFVDRRTKLNEHDARMHKVHAPTGKSIYEMQGALLRLPTDVVSQLRWRGPELMQISGKKAERAIDLLREAAAFETLFTRTDSSPWTGVELKDGQTVERAVDRVSNLSCELIPNLIKSLDQISEASGLRLPNTMAEVYETLNVIARINQIHQTYLPDVFIKAKDLVEAMMPGEAPGLNGLWARLTNASYKAARRSAMVLRRGVKASMATIVKELNDVASASDAWKAMCESGAGPKAQRSEECGVAYEAALAAIHDLAGICKSNWDQTKLSDLFARVSAMSSDNTTPFRLQRLFEIECELQALGIQRLIDEIRRNRIPVMHWVQLFEHVWLKSTLDMAAIADPSIRGFVGSFHDAYVEDFKRLDSARLTLAADRVRRAHAERTIAAMNEFPEQETLIRGEAAKSRRHKPLRQIFSCATDVLTAVCPCWMASPLSVSQLIDATNVFDFVIFDEASQVLPEDAVPAILRGKHVIVAGDNKQLPPSAFFSAAEDDDDDEADSDATAYESLLDMMIPFVKGFHLNWHYRSRDEALISFSNHHIYDDRLVTFPGPGGPPAISHVFVDYLPTSDVQEDSSSGEVGKVVELILQHARTTPGQTLGVITMGQKHSNRIQGLLDRELTKNPQLADFFDTARRERFFVKNLERVQGDERDVIILSVGYGKDRAGNLPLRFGPILSAGGRRRLNVAATRAKERIVVVSSFLYSEISSKQVRVGTGLEFLKNYLEYASSGGRMLSSSVLTNEPMNDFEADVFDALSGQGIELVPQVGCSKFRIDLAASHPTRPGRFVLAIECDGSTYHSSYTARDRDRLRQQQLESLGWTFHRIWSTDWFMRRDEEVTRAVQAFRKAVESSDNGEVTRLRAPVESIAQPSSTLPQSTPAQRPYPSAPIPKKSSIAEYTNRELNALLEWVKSDGKLRTNDELADEMFEALPFARRGSKIEAALRRTIG